MAKRELHRFHVQVPQRSNQRRGRKLVIRLVKDSKTTSVPKNGKSGETGAIPQGVAPKAIAYRENGEDAIPTSPSLLSNRTSYRQSRTWRWSLLWLSILCVLGGTLVSGLLLLTKLPPPIDCRNISPLSADGNRLYCARLAAESGKLDQLVGAIKLVQDWPSNHPLYPEAQRMMKDWSGEILRLAQQKINQGNESEAVTIASKIPPGSPLYSEAQTAIGTWKQEWRQGEKIQREFQDALREQNWQQASELILKLSQIDRDYWRLSQVNDLMEQLDAEKEEWEMLEEARGLAEAKTVEQLEAAIALARKISPKSYVKAAAQKEISNWSQNLLEIAAELFESQDFANAIDVAERVPTNTPQHSEARDWITLSRASRSANEDNILVLMDALSAVRQIDAKSPVRKVALEQAKTWEQQLQDRTHLKVAEVVAGFNQRMGLAYAKDLAGQIAPDRPQRITAQTLIAQWQKEIQEIEDRNKLFAAQELAKGGTLEDLRGAVALANQIQLGQPLRIDAQTEIAKWNKHIQTHEDQPILDLAETLALRRDLMAAIATAGQIRPERALYETAQEAIAHWVEQLQIDQDRPILEAANALATQGRFNDAIATAAQIAPDRPLYQQAQAAIATWTQANAAMNSGPLSLPLDTN